MRGPNSMTPAPSAGPSASTGISSAAAVRRNNAASPVGSAAATTSSRCVRRGKAWMRRMNSSSRAAVDERLPVIQNPPASSTADALRGTSTMANGIPRVSATMRSRTRGSMPACITESSSSLASASDSPATSISGNPASTSGRSRTAKTIATGSASRRRATKPNVCSETWSSHWASSTMQSTGRSVAAAASRLNTARPTRKRSGTVPDPRPKATSSAPRCGSGSSPRSGAHNCCSPANASSMSDSTPTTRVVRNPSARTAA